MRIRTFAFLLAWAVLFVVGSARAQSKPVSQTTEYSPYEREAIKGALEGLKLEVDPAPEGKIIDRVDIVRLDVIEDRDVDWLGRPIGPFGEKVANALHYTTRDWIIRREMLLKEGDRWEQVTIDEIARNMRSRMTVQISLVIIVPVKSSTPGHVSVLVITKDVWSLRLSYNLSVTPGGVEDLLIVPQETNLLGLQHTVSTRFRYQPESYTLGVGYSVPRFGTTWIGATAAADVFLNRRDGSIEGSAMSASIGQGLYSTRTEWSWSASGGYSVGVARLYSNAHLATFDPTPRGDSTDDIPIQYRTSTVSAGVGVTRSFGWALKNNFGLTMNFTRMTVRGINLDSFAPAEVAAFRQAYFPVGEDRVFPSLSWATFRNDYLRTLDVNTLALQEDFRLGHDVGASFYPVPKALGSTRDLIGVTGHAGYAVPVGDGIVGASVSTVAENDLEQKTVTDGSVTGAFGAATPRFGIGRVVMNASFVNRYRNYLNAMSSTGGNGRLRGYPSNFFLGKDVYFYNIEFRTTSAKLLFSRVGAVAFYDAGDAADGFDKLSPKQSVGAGLRILFPQINRLVTRLDVAVPLRRGPFPNTATCTAPDAATAKLQGCAPVDPWGFSITIDQAFGP